MAETLKGAKELARIYMSKDIPFYVHGRPGIGKCLAEGTVVLMHNGDRLPVQMIKVGDQLMGPDSQPRTVLTVTSGNDEMYEVVPTKGKPYTVNSAHILSLKKSPSQSGDEHEVINVSVTDYLNLTAAKKHHLKGWRTGVDFAHQNVTVPPYIMGIWLGDGRKSGPAITNPDAEIIDACTTYAQSFGGNVSHYQNFAFRINGAHGGHHNNPFWEELRQYGLGDEQSKFIPPEYLKTSRAARLELLAGLLDSDGSLANTCYEISQVLPDMRDGIMFLAQSLGFAATCSEREAKPELGGNTHYRMIISGNTAEIPTKVARKKAPVRQQKKDVLVTGVTVKSVGTGRYYGFTLDADGLFLLGDFTVTHNSDMWFQLAKERKIGFIDLRLGMMDPCDLLGLPVAHKGQTTWAKPAYWPDEERDGPEGILLFDELSDCSRAMQSAAYQLILNGRAGPHVLPKGWYRCAAGNRRADKAAAQQLSTALANRFAHADIEPDTDSFIEWCNATNIDFRVPGFIRFRPALLHNMENSDLRAFPSPRSWAKAALVCDAPVAQRFRLMQGLIGEGAASEFEAYMKTMDLPDFEDILADPKKCHIPKEPSHKYALASMLSRRMARDNMGKVAAYIQRKEFGRDFEIACMLDATNREQALTETSAFTDFANRNSDLHL